MKTDNVLWPDRIFVSWLHVEATSLRPNVAGESSLVMAAQRGANIFGGQRGNIEDSFGL